MKIGTIHLLDQKAQPLGELAVSDASDRRARCSLCVEWTTEPSGLSAGTHLDALLEHLAADH